MSVSKWKKAGVARLSESARVVNLGIFGSEATKWFIIDVENLFKVIQGKKYEVPIFEAEK